MDKWLSEPWEYLSETTYYNDYPYGKCHRIKIGNETLTVSCHGYDWKGEAEEEAKARLMAAAPDLYRTLKMAVLWLDNLSGVSVDTKALHRALAKAEGKEAQP
jgi:hypothetical protein